MLERKRRRCAKFLRVGLTVAWRWSSPELMTGDGGQGARPTTPRNHEAIPIKVGDRLYVTTGYGQIAAVELIAYRLPA